jgi:wyosine [tRNA(Phe)-imidazoG37] synthetase (radical SAM superfamily)
MATTKPRVLNFADHRRALGENRYVYAVVSRRAGGLSIGLNLNPDKICNFDCPYCQVDRTVEARWKRVDVLRLEAELDQLLALVASGSFWQTAPFDTVAPPLRRIADLSLAGDGEPTSSRAFAEVVAICGRLRDRYGLGALPILVLTNATLFDRPRVQEGLERLATLGGSVWAKLDAGTEPYFRRVAKTPIPFQNVLDNLQWAALRYPLVIQSLFCRIDGVEPQEE